MRLSTVPPLLFALSACGNTGPLPRTPDVRVADEIEAKLSKVPCVGPMSRWERHYEFSSDPSVWANILTVGAEERWFNYDSVEISYAQAGFEEFKSRRVLQRGWQPPDIDDRQYNLVFGHYDIPTHTAYIWACGPNLFSTGGDDPRHPKIVVH